MKFVAVSLILLLIFWELPIPATAQSDDCAALLDEALSAAALNCGRVDTNTACLGYPGVEAIINCDADPDFKSPGDTVTLESMCGMRVGGLQLPDQWGVSIMQVRPAGADQDIRYVLIGNIDLRNAGSAFTKLHVVVEQDINVRSGPGSEYEVIGTLPAGAQIDANACSCTRLWLRTTLEGGRVGWFPARAVTVAGDTNTLPVAQANTPVYESMQAFTFSSEVHEASCAGFPPDGILIQSPSDVNLLINDVEIALNSTIFVQSHTGDEMMIDVLDGSAQVISGDFAVTVPAGARAIIPMSELNTPDGLARVLPYALEEVANLPLDLLTEGIAPPAVIGEESLQIVGVEPCAVLSGSGEAACPLHFINPDGDRIARMDVQFVSAPEGEWTGSVHEFPVLLDGNNTSGRLAWNVSCLLKSNCFIGPVIWRITITDEAGHVSEPFEASFNCVAG